ncbi:sulfotransferase [Cognatishimia sp. F0-27]|uniref:tetratricopeptide repeat-containing sulfotransferase family protein n=1 Tax=Cognatishimia sp. F0-27 TaxID=2816855 RepID=UPI001D0C4B81|nr:sulfotransferase [Cognatishimia sp. F0-27]MCC1491426.1 sulfotransferase [Cognatishimia sp. F0-27]
MPLRPTPRPRQAATGLQGTLEAGRKAFAEARFDRARACFETILKSAPTHAESHVYLSRIAWETGDAAQSVAQLERVAALSPDSPRAQLALAERYGQVGETEKALAAYDRATALSPAKSIAPQAEKARFLQALGRFEEAAAIFRKLIKRHPGEAELYSIFLGGTRLPKGDPVLRQMRKLWADKTLPETKRMHLGFALAKALDDTGDPDKAMAVLDRANAIQKSLAPYDRAARDSDWLAMRDAQADADLTPPQGRMTPRPVIVCGLPRSGTTLVEQIIGRHDHARAGGEMGHILRVAVRQFEREGVMTPLSQIPAPERATYAATVARLMTRDTGATEGVVTDKSIRNFQMLGWIRAMLPEARIVIVTRDPRAVALSMWRNHFQIGTHRYANDWADIADEIKRFRAIIAYWKGRMPGVIHEVRYEDLVSEPEPVARALLEHVGLEWQDRVLDAAATKGTVQTLSLAQVRAPISHARREAWRRYETRMAPFIAAWGDETWD